MSEPVAIYEREHSAHAWKFIRVANIDAAKLAKDVSAGFGVETLILTGTTGPFPQFLDSSQI